MFPRTHALGGTTQGCGKLRSEPWPLGAPGKEAENEWPWPQGGRCRERWPRSRLGSERPVWQRPEPFRNLCGCWLLLTYSLFQPFLSAQTGNLCSPTPYNPGRFGQQRISLEWRSEGSPGGVGLYWVSGSQASRELDFYLSRILVILAKPLCSLGLDVLICTMEQEAWF